LIELDSRKNLFIFVKSELFGAKQDDSITKIWLIEAVPLLMCTRCDAQTASNLHKGF